MDVREDDSTISPEPPEPKQVVLTSRPTSRSALVLGWVALGISVVVSALWAFWGTLEAFHEGWWAPTLGGRLLQTFFYLLAMLITITLSLLSIRWPKLGAMIYFLFGTAFTIFIFKERWGNLTWEIVLSWLPVTVMVAGVGLLWWFGRPQPKRWAYLVALAVPLLTCVICAVEPIWRVSHRDMTPQLGELTLPGNGVELTWAPAGPGWVRGVKYACDWDTATDICARLSEDGTQLMETPQGYWRLPTAAEMAASFTRNGKNSGGTWDSMKMQPNYEVWPDKEPPLWDPISETTYWWSSTVDGPDRAYFATFEGRFYSGSKHRRLGSMGFRAVRCATPLTDEKPMLVEAGNGSAGEPSRADGE